MIAARLQVSLAPRHVSSPKKLLIVRFLYFGHRWRGQGPQLSVILRAFNAGRDILDGRECGLQRAKTGVCRVGLKSQVVALCQLPTLFWLSHLVYIPSRLVLTGPLVQQVRKR